jgi:hypothetical protein
MTETPPTEKPRHPGLLATAYGPVDGKPRPLPNPIRACTEALRKQRQRDRYGTPAYTEEWSHGATSAPRAAVQTFDAHDVKGQRKRRAENLQLHRKTQIERLGEKRP